MPGFLKLPLEVRNMVYEYLVVLPNWLELAPRGLDPVNPSHRPLRICNVDWKREICPRLRFFRTCRQVATEGAARFYGQNEFRFSDEDGWQVLDAFMHTIGPQNTAYLRCITVRNPWFGKRDVSEPDTGDELRQQDQKWRRYERSTEVHILQMGLKFPRRLQLRMKAVERCRDRFHASGGLTALNLTLPVDWIVTDEVPNSSRLRHSAGYEEMSPILQPERFGNLKVTILSLAYDADDVRRCESRHRRARELAGEQGWRFLETRAYRPNDYFELTEDT